MDTNFVLHYSCGMKNLTITVDPEVARWARVHAARHDTSVSRMVGELLRRYMLEEGGVEPALRDYLSRGPVSFTGSERYPTRDESHER